ncbi:unnamed protein product (macronuclear) [Paramecium tetraurelia]|uniref:E2F/DP family winged-helix DNA-binding domain-containing protein n=1 Tax=Paramecium tetraurelia TaxID=5888 RepID=A0BNU0_PARTE|nr:uncharacterized protein GSPATT00030846001 [Paramecium tetraurelia]CAK60207.1 unnamed protein product [Paramecium tetraurelia]|eukprot:XP_001427605.1 hypothetical protein (macronuclear) [Paramecium tetraurelia strain d4-2]
MKRSQRRLSKCVGEDMQSDSSKQESDSEFIITETSESEKLKSKSIWSLKGLSFQIKTLVKDLKSTNYKILANILIEKLQNELQKMQSTERRKEIQNLKRRVYDAINVMVAMGVLEKDKKKQISFHEQKDKEEVNKQKEQVRTNLEILKEKRKRLTKATLTYMMYKKLIQRNQQMKMEPESKLETPVFAFSVQLFDNDLCMQQKNGKKIIIKSQQPIYIYSELEVLQKLQLK